jgi:hypothetical protein
MTTQTAEFLRDLHRRLHMKNVPHDCREYYRTEAELLYKAIGKYPSLYPDIIVTFYPGMWN